MYKQNIIIVGAGPAGLTAAAELSENGQAVALIEEDTQYVGGIARTVDYRGSASTSVGIGSSARVRKSMLGGTGA